MRHLSKFLVAMLSLVAGLALSACELTPPTGDFPELTYGHLAPLSFDVASVEVEQAYQPSSEAPNVELLFPVRPDQAAANWGRDRLRAVGATRRMRFIVREAPVIETALKTKTGLAGVVTVTENATLLEREKVWYGLTQKLMNDMNARLEDSLKRVFFRYLR